MVAVNNAIARMQRLSRLAAKRSREYLTPAVRSDRRMVFVAGQQRSGTNMLMDVLDRHRQTDVYHETDARAFENYQMRDLATIKALFARSRASHVVIKALCELQRLRDLMDAFPQSQAIWLVRHYHDVANSMARQFSSTAQALKLMRRDPALGGWRGERLSPSVKSLLDDCVTDEISEISAAAFQWYMRNKLYFDQELFEDRRVRIVFYEDLVTWPERTFKRLADHIGVDFHPALVGKVVASSINKAPNPPIDARIESLCGDLHQRLMHCAQTQA